MGGGNFNGYQPANNNCGRATRQGRGGTQPRPTNHPAPKTQGPRCK